MNMSLDDLASSSAFGGGKGRREQISWLPEPEPRERTYTVIFVDDHVVEPRDAFTGRFPKRFADELFACANIVPGVESIYRWQGKVESSQEWLLLIKTTAEKFPLVRDAIRELHSYELPECVALSIEDGSHDYLQWLDDSVK